MRSPLALALALALALSTACGADDVMGDGDGDSDAAGGCIELPSITPPWLADYQLEVVERLAGARPLPSGQTLGPRATVATRDIARAYLMDELTALGLSPTVHDYGTGGNPHATIAATEASQNTLLLGAHFDTVPGSPGANDNATGVAMVLAAARYLGELECRDHDVIVVLFDEEEIGLVGSAAFAAKLDSENTTLLAAHTIDQMGWDDNGDRLVEVELPGPGQLAFYQSARDDAGLTAPLVETSTGSTDHTSFRNRGFTAVGLTEGFISGDTTPHYHAPTDTADTVNHPYLQNSTSLLLSAFGGLVFAQQ